MSISDADYQRWLETPGNLRCALFELTFLGNNGGAAGEFHAYIGNMPYVTDGDETPANRIFEACVLEVPSFSRRMSEQLAGRSTLSYGDLIVANDDGCRNQWLRMNWDGRRVRQWLGDPSWAFADFRLVLDGVIDDVFDAGGRKIGFRIADKSTLLDRPVMTTLIGGSGPGADKVMPLALGGSIWNISPVLIDENEHTYRVTATDPTNYIDLMPVGETMGSTNIMGEHTGIADIREDGVSIFAFVYGFIVAINGNALRTFAPHTLQVNSRLRFTADSPGAPPAPLAMNVDYWVIADGLTADEFKLAATPGGAEIAIVGGLGSYTPSWRGYSWTYEDGVLRIAGAPAGRITIDCNGLCTGRDGWYPSWHRRPGAIARLLLDSGSSITNTPLTSADLAGDLETVDYENAAAFLGKYVTEQTTFAEVLDELFISFGGWWTFSRDGKLKGGVLKLPTVGTPAYSFVADDMALRTMQLLKRILPRAEIKVRGGKNHTVQETVAGSVSEYDRELYALPHFEKTGVATVTTWDTSPANHKRVAYPEPYATDISHWNWRDHLGNQIRTASTRLQDEAKRLATLFRYPTGIYRFETHQAVFLLELGDLIYVESAPYTGYGIVTALEERAKGRSAIEFFCQLPDHYPTEDIA